VKAPKCSGCRRATQVSARASEGAITKNNISGFMSEYPAHGRRDATAEARSAPQDGAAGAPQPRHMMPCACHCAACRAAGHGDGACVVLCAGLHALFDGKADVVDVLLRHYYGACGWGTVHIDAKIYCVQYGPAGDVIAAGSSDGRIHFICAQTGEKILCFLTGHQAGVSSVHFSPDGTRLVTRSSRGDKTVKIWNPATGEELCQLKVDHRIFCLSYAPNGDMLAVGDQGGNINVFNSQGEKLQSPVRGENAILILAFSPDGQLIATGEGNPHDPRQAGAVRIYCASTGQLKRALRGHDYQVLSVSWSPDGTQLASGSVDSTVRLWDASTGAPIGSPLNVDAGAGGVRSVSFSPSGDMVAAGCWNGKIHFMDAAAGQIKSSVRGHSAVVRSVCFSSDGKQLTSGSDDKTVRNWDLAARASLS